MARVPSEIKEAIKSRIDIVEIASEYTTLKRTGNNLYSGKCPFPHGGTEDQPRFDENPSFIIYPNNTFYCFGCGRGSRDNGGAGSDTIALLMELEHIGYIEACKILADRAGINFYLENNEAPEKKSILERTTEYNRLFFKNLWNNHPDVAVKIANERGISLEFLREKARIGLVPSDYNWLLVRNRIAVGIPEMTKMPNPRTVAMGYRHPGDGEPKWVNDSASEIFDKGSTLYFYPYAYKSIRKQGYAIVMEGYFDVLGAHYYGFTNAVGIMGKRFTDQQMDILRKDTDKIMLWPDGDEAGHSIITTSLERLLERDFKIFWIKTPGLDPGDFFKQNTGRDLNSLIAQHTNYALSAIMEELTEQKGEADKITALDKLIPYLKAIKRPGEKVYFYNEVGSKFNIDINVLSYC